MLKADDDEDDFSDCQSFTDEDFPLPSPPSPSGSSAGDVGTLTLDNLLKHEAATGNPGRGSDFDSGNFDSQNTAPDGLRLDEVEALAATLGSKVSVTPSPAADPAADPAAAPGDPQGPPGPSPSPIDNDSSTYTDLNKGLANIGVQGGREPGPRTSNGDVLPPAPPQGAGGAAEPPGPPADPDAAYKMVNQDTGEIYDIRDLESVPMPE